jgi:hypothetical protein
MKKNLIDNNFQFDFRTDARNSSDWGWDTTLAKYVFGSELTPEIQRFLDSLGDKWTKIPREWLDPTTAQNFICFARKATRQIKI